MFSAYCVLSPIKYTKLDKAKSYSLISSGPALMSSAIYVLEKCDSKTCVDKRTHLETNEIKSWFQFECSGERHSSKVAEQGRKITSLLLKFSELLGRCGISKYLK